MIGKYISELLYRFDSVTLPGFGTFMKKSSENIVHPVDTVFAPPATELTFDPTQQHNDGVLANYISEKETIAFFEALEKIRLFIQKLNAQLDSEKVFEMQELGTFSKENNQLVFSSKNNLCFNPSLFGLPEINAKPIIRPELKHAVSASKTIIQQKVKKKKRIGLMVTVSLAVLILLCVAAVFVFKPYQNPKYSEYFSPIPGFERKKPVGKNSFEKSQANTIIFGNFYRLSCAGDTLKSKSEVAEKNTTTSIGNIMQTGNYVIVAGSFNLQENADNYVSKLKLKGYTPVLIEAANGMHMVCYGTYPDLNSANQKLQEIKTSENPAAWVLKH